MFTGLIEETGKLRGKTASGSGFVFKIGARTVLEDLNLGDSVSLNGVCLTVVEIGVDFFKVQAVRETLANSTAQFWEIGEALNLERAMLASARLGGHLVQGHIDGVGTVQSIQTGELETVIRIAADSEVMRYIVRKGSVSVDGISLTVAEAEENTFSVAVIPHTGENTNFKYLKTGDKVNIETDIIARYVEKFIIEKRSGSTLTEENLRRAGF